MRGQCLRLWCASDLVWRCWTACSPGRRQSGIASIANSGAIGEASYQLGVGSGGCCIAWSSTCFLVHTYCSRYVQCALVSTSDQTRWPYIHVNSNRASWQATGRLNLYRSVLLSSIDHDQARVSQCVSLSFLVLFSLALFFLAAQSQVRQSLDSQMGIITIHAIRKRHPKPLTTPQRRLTATSSMLRYLTLVPETASAAFAISFSCPDAVLPSSAPASA